MAVIGSLSVKLGLVTVEWDKATAQAKQQAKQLQNAFNDLTADVKKLGEAWKTLGGSIGVGSVGFTALIYQTAEFADKIDDLSKAFGVSTGFALQFNNALQQAGASSEAAGRVINKLFENIESAKEGNQASVDQFRNLGISFSEIKKLSPEDAIKRVFAELSKIEDPIKRVSEMRKAFGKGGLGLDVQEVSALLEGGVGKWQKYGEQLEKVSKVKDNLTASLNNLLIAFAQFIGPLTRDGTVSVEKFTGALAGMFAYFVASKIVAAATAMMQIVAAIRAATAASVAFNLATAGTPMGLLLKLGAMGVGAAVYGASTGAFERDARNRPGANATYGEEPPSLSAETEANNPAVIAAAAAAVSGDSETTLQEAAAQMALLTERTKTANATALASVPVWDTYRKTITQINADQALALAQIKQKQAEINNSFKDSPTLLEIETAKLKEQEKQININANARRKEATDAKSLLDYETERLRQLGYTNGELKMQADIQARNLETNRHLLEVKKQEIIYQEEISKLSLDSYGAMSPYAKKRAIEMIGNKSALDRLKADLAALPSFVEALPGEELSKEAEANNRRRENIQKQIEFEQQRHELRMTNMEVERTFEYGWQKSMNEFLDQSENAAKRAQDSFGSIVSNMESALTSFVRNGKMSFKDLARSIIQDLLLIQMKAQLSGIFRMLGMGFGNPIGASGYSDIGTFNALIAAGGLADGGPIGANEMHLVGERGPELFVPKNSGTVVPNEKLGSLGSTTINNYNIQAIDVKSFEQRLMGSSKAIWAANQYASKGLAITPGRG